MPQPPPGDPFGVCSGSPPAPPRLGEGPRGGIPSLGHPRNPRAASRALRGGIWGTGGAHRGSPSPSHIRAFLGLPFLPPPPQNPLPKAGQSAGGSQTGEHLHGAELYWVGGAPNSLGARPPPPSPSPPGLSPAAPAPRRRPQPHLAASAPAQPGTGSALGGPKTGLGGGGSVPRALPPALSPGMGKGPVPSPRCRARGAAGESREARGGRRGSLLLLLLLLLLRELLAGEEAELGPRGRGGRG